MVVMICCRESCQARRKPPWMLHPVATGAQISSAGCNPMSRSVTTSCILCEPRKERAMSFLVLSMDTNPLIPDMPLLCSKLAPFVDVLSHGNSSYVLLKLQKYRLVRVLHVGAVEVRGPTTYDAAIRRQYIEVGCAI
jgi:hypothetical protein